MKAQLDASITDPLVLEVRATPASLVFSVSDAGAGFDFTPAEPLEHARAAARAAESGSLGLALVRSLFGATDVRRNDGPGMTVSFSLDLATSHEEE
jgi:signal transduction histidine kinase